MIKLQALKRGRKVTKVNSKSAYRKNKVSRFN